MVMVVMVVAMLMVMTMAMVELMIQSGESCVKAFCTDTLHPLQSLARLLIIDLVSIFLRQRKKETKQTNKQTNIKTDTSKSGLLMIYDQ